MGIPDHPEIARALKTGYPKPLRSVACVDCGAEMYGSHRIYISDGEVVCAPCLKERILDENSIDNLAEAFDVRKTTAHDFIEEREEPY